MVGLLLPGLCCILSFLCLHVSNVTGALTVGCRRGLCRGGTCQRHLTTCAWLCGLMTVHTTLQQASALPHTLRILEAGS